MKPNGHGVNIDFEETGSPLDDDLQPLGWAIRPRWGDAALHPPEGFSFDSVVFVKFF